MKYMGVTAGSRGGKRDLDNLYPFLSKRAHGKGPGKALAITQPIGDFTDMTDMAVIKARPLTQKPYVFSDYKFPRHRSHHSLTNIVQCAHHWPFASQLAINAPEIFNALLSLSELLQWWKQSSSLRNSTRTLILVAPCNRTWRKEKHLSSPTHTPMINAATLLILRHL
ncbi:hypothetical protein CEXT_137341 [Caerostris extrusa]|uniref:Uncharacterized protein n=1 Tax=Caerostris extrusa TaxID=172846 RepID=A0AAV4WIA7_CAEEX|nr:hypothetical protein CEXT_137341 [Caerostris extrusa]